MAKNTGKAYVPNGQASAALEPLFAGLRIVGIFIVECGELEEFAETIGSHGPAWVNEALKRDLAHDPELADARKFVLRFCFPMRPDLKATIDGHIQKFENSCATSLAEILLKLENEFAPDLQRHETAKSTGLDHIKDKTYGRVTFRQLTRPYQARVETEIRDGRNVGIFIKNKYFDPSSDRLHGWVAHDIVDRNRAPTLRLIAKHSELGNGEGKQTGEREMPLADVDGAAVTDVICYDDLNGK